MIDNEPKFTPEPWTVLYEGSDMSIEPGIAYWSKHDIMGRTEDEIDGKWRIIQANAALIAAAPEMYALLDELRDNYVQNPNGIRKINKQLAKCRGEKTNE